VIYVENDPMLRSMMIRALEPFDEISIFVATGSSAEVVDSDSTFGWLRKMPSSV